MDPQHPGLDDPKTALQVATRYAGALERAPVPVVEHDGGLRITRWNRSAERAFGFKREEAVGRSVAELILPGGSAEAWQRLAREGGDATFICARKDGSAVRCAWRWEPILDDRGEPAGAICFGQDEAPQARMTDLQHKEQLLHVLMNSLPVCVWAIDPQGLFTIHEGKGLASAGFEPGQFIGQNLFELYASTPEGMAPVRKVLEGETVQYTTESHGIEWENWILPIRGDHGEVAGAVGITLDISQRKHTEQELRAQLDLVTRQQQVIRELSTPIIEVWDRVLTLPMVGVIDSARTAEMMDSLLEAVVRAGARFAVLDLTGVEVVDTQTAAYLIELVRAIRLLGADGIITGIRPTVAQTVIALGLDLTSITTLSNLRAGLKYCILQMSREQGGDGGTGGGGGAGAGAGRGAPSRGEGPRAKAERPAQLAGRSSPPGRRWA